MTLLIVIFAAMTLLTLATINAVLLGWASKVFAVETDPRVEKIVAVLPGANCGGCGYVGCGEYAEAVARGEATVDLCAPGGAACVQAIATIMGVEAESTAPMRVVVHCGATCEQRRDRSVYLGEPSCAAANLVAGVQACVYGCLGFGDCADACPFDALEIVNGLATVDYEKCTGCGACVDACPRGILSVVSFTADRMPVVACSNRDFGNDVRRACDVGCIGCRVCTRESDLLRMDGDLAFIDYKPDTAAEADFAAAAKRCPMNCLTTVGRPQFPESPAVKLDRIPGPALPAAAADNHTALATGAP